MSNLSLLRPPQLVTSRVAPPPRTSVSHASRTLDMASDAGATGARDPDAGVTTFEQLPRDVKNEILGPTNLPEPADLGRLRAVSHWMRAAVDATGREIKEVSDKEAAKLGYVSLLKDRLSRGVLDYTGYLKGYLCEAAARKGDLEELKAFGG